MQKKKPAATSVCTNYRNNRYPLKTKPFVELPLGSVRPSGWLEEQMNRMRTGLTGNLDNVYGHVMGSRNGWLGGDGDVWERGPCIYFTVSQLRRRSLATSFIVAKGSKQMTKRAK